jgi:hypothetical protein
MSRGKGGPERQNDQHHAPGAYSTNRTKTKGHTFEWPFLFSVWAYVEGFGVARDAIGTPTPEARRSTLFPSCQGACAVR